MPTFADRVIAFNEQLHFEGALPPGIRIMNPFAESEEVRQVSAAFYRKFYSDTQTRRLILGINPGRLGAGATGIPFTDTKRLAEKCDLHISTQLHEPSSVFIYEVIDAMGGPAAFYRWVYIHSVCPLGFVKRGKNGRQVNYNYYDSPALEAAARPFILQNLRQQIQFGVHTDRVLCLGIGKNFQFLQKINAEHRLFGEIVPLEHPRFIMQYKARHRSEYIAKYVETLSALPNACHP